MGHDHLSEIVTCSDKQTERKKKRERERNKEKKEGKNSLKV
jgi:hypothetical protein